jgi:hypothetical protein
LLKCTGTPAERKATSLNLNLMLYVALFLLLVGLFLFSLLRRKDVEPGRRNDPSGPGPGDAAPGSDDREDGK